MTSIFLSSCTNFFLVRWISELFGFLINILYEVLTKLGIGKISVCIIVFTIIVKLLMLPMSIKQQKAMKLNTVINPEIQAIQKKYANKRDNESIMKQQEELNAVYQKYGTSPTSGCMPLLIQMPIIFGLYAIMSCLPNYIEDVQTMYNDGVISEVIGSYEDGEFEHSTIKELKNIDKLSDKLLEDDEKDNALDTMIEAYYGKDEDYEEDKVEEVVYNSFTSAYNNPFGSKSAFDAVKEAIEQAQVNIQELKELDKEDWEDVEDKESLYKYSENTSEEWDALSAKYDTILANIEAGRSEIKEVYSFFTMDLSTSPADDMKKGIHIAIIIPLMSALSQLINMKISMSNQQKTGNATADSMMSSMKIMNYSLCLVSAIFCYNVPAGLGLYWVVGSIVQGILQVILNAKFRNMSVDDIIKSNLEKINKQRERAGLAPNTISTAASVNTKNYKTQTVETNNVSTANSSAKKGSISEKANLAKKYADKK